MSDQGILIELARQMRLHAETKRKSAMSRRAEARKTTSTPMKEWHDKWAERLESEADTYMICAKMNEVAAERLQGVA